MAQTTEYNKVDLRVGTESQFNAKVDTLPEGTLFGVTDATVSKADLSTDLKNEINGKINKPANPTSDSAVVINSSGAISTKPLTSITSKSEVAVQGTTPTGDEILWINPNGTSGGGSDSGGKLYKHGCIVNVSTYTCNLTFFDYQSTPHTIESAFASPRIGYSLSATIDMKVCFGIIDSFADNGYVQWYLIPYRDAMTGSSVDTYSVISIFGQKITSLTDTVTEI